MSYMIFLDDERVPEGVTWKILPSHYSGDWVILRSYDEFVTHITAAGLPAFIAFDHDLADEHYVDGYPGNPPKYDKYKERTGYHCAQWLLDYCLKHKLSVPRFAVHSMNQVGGANIRAVLDPANVARLRELFNNL
jgi:hypothetical protein